uniref:Uncharacterized protein n=1 Tax=Arundo donax TaxID=35708 RepID=A0A0A9HJD7_ARUDO
MHYMHKDLLNTNLQHHAYFIDQVQTCIRIH